MQLHLVILESRGPHTPVTEAAAIVPEHAEVPTGYAVIDRIIIPDRIAREIAPLFGVDTTVQWTRDQLLGLLAYMGRIGHEAGVALGKQSITMTETEDE